MTAADAADDADRYTKMLAAITTAEEVVASARLVWYRFIEDRAERGARKPYPTCDEKDAWHPRYLPSHPEFDEDDLVATTVCQLPEDHRDLGYRNHLEMRDGEVWGAWS